MPAPPTRTDVTVDGRTLQVSNLEKPLYPTGFTKGQVIDYYVRVSAALLPHVADKPMTLKRYPNGVDGQFFYEKNCPGHRPEWVETAPVRFGEGHGLIDFCLIKDLATLVWVANLAALELHPILAPAADVNRPASSTGPHRRARPGGARATAVAAHLPLP